MPDGALLVDVDRSTFPNLALMHISAWRKQEGLKCGFHINDPAEVWASCVFKANRHKADGLKFLYPDALVDIGGSGISLNKSLPDEVNHLMPDYGLYPDLDYSLGFSTRGCIRNCPFCIVPKKEGGVHINQHPREWHNPNFKKIMFLDNNILALESWFYEVADWIKSNKLIVDFNQGLDIRLVNDTIAETLAELRPFRIWRIAFDNIAYKDALIRGVGCLTRAGINVRSNVQSYVYVDSDNDFNDALTRCNILRGLGICPFVMLNRDAKRTQRLTDLKRWCMPWFFYKMPFEDYNHSFKGVA